MAERNWRALFEQMCALADHQQAHLRWANATLLVERRGPVLVALREVPESAHRQVAWPQRPNTFEDAQNMQRLYVANRHFLCSWRRQPTEWSWLQALAAVEL